MSDNNVRHMVLTIKYGAGHDAPWAVFHGQPNEVREDILSWFGVDSESVVGLTGSDIAINASDLARGKGNAFSGLGATVINTTIVNNGEPETGNPWANLDESEKANPFQHVIDAFNAAADVKELQKVWAANQNAFTDPDVVAAYKARGKELS